MSDLASRLDASFDVILAILMIAVAWRALASRDGFESVALFITFGVMASLAWVRLGSVDVALAEAAIGTGVAGALFVASLVAFERSERDDREEGGADPGQLREDADGD